ncbi:MAG TPA: response regulator [Desulfobacteraceae bacterium]|nr:response regulator [Desulfobacteraceae bacterium]
MKAAPVSPGQKFNTKNTKPLLLVIEDNPDNMTTVKAVLGPDYAIIGAADGRRGLEKAISVLPDLILLDMSLPEMDGYEVAAALKKDERTVDIPVVALTAQAMKGDRERILAAGCNDYIAKPIDPDAISKTLAKWL